MLCYFFVIQLVAVLCHGQGVTNQTIRAFFIVGRALKITESCSPMYIKWLRDVIIESGCSDTMYSEAISEQTILSEEHESAAVRLSSVNMVVYRSALIVIGFLKCRKFNNFLWRRKRLNEEVVGGKRVYLQVAIMFDSKAEYEDKGNTQEGPAVCDYRGGICDDCLCLCASGAAG